ncbi:MAG: divergent polysaccharide deacetylase family protein, partial [Pseudomonadota bacterium]
MTARIPKDPSPIKAGFVHGAMSLTALGLVFGAAGGLIHLTGDADAGSPNVEIALFDENGEVAPTLKTRLPSESVDRKLVMAALDVNGARAPVEEPSLGVEYGRPAPQRTVTPKPATAQPAPQAEGIRINGKLVAPGQSLSQIERPVTSEGTRKTITVASATPNAAPETTPTAVARPDTPFEKYARPFENPEGKPTVSIIVGGMGINWRHTQAAINELPAEVTLSFAPGAKNLTTWVRRARADGHEVLIELPMEPYSYGRTRPHPQILQ